MKRRTRRHALGLLAAATLAAGGVLPLAAWAQAGARRWYDAAFALRRQAEAAGDQPYGAVVVFEDRLAGEGRSRVVLDANVDAHAERVAILDAQHRLARADLGGAILYSTSRPCRLCEQAAARAGIARMVYGEGLQDGGRPQP